LPVTVLYKNEVTLLFAPKAAYHCVEAEDIGEAVALPAEIVERREGKAVPKAGLFVLELRRQDDDLLRGSHGQRPEIAVQTTEDGSIDANAQGDSEHHDDREARVVPCLSCGELKILQECLHRSLRLPPIVRRPAAHRGLTAPPLP
jgi:hypothetical protein